ncbi:OmpA/MotB family protein [Puia sp. P3]|uniref:OmpA/MotB family protein n=1 Tax=Puia sp. P3 TaxID=3423952 RepID=UPI003D675430
MRTLKACQDDNAQLKKQKIDIQTKMSDQDLMLTVTQENNAQLKKQLQSLSAISSAQAESIKKSIDNINSKDDYLQTLQMAVSRRDSTNLAVLIELKAAMGSLGEDVHIRVLRGLVNVDFSDKLLFSSDSNSYVFGEKAKQAVGRLARVLNDHPEVSCIVEGNTDSIAYPQDILLDNWDLSVKRATAIVRSLQNDYNISPAG